MSMALPTTMSRPLNPLENGKASGQTCARLRTVSSDVDDSRSCGLALAASRIALAQAVHGEPSHLLVAVDGIGVRV